MGNSPEVGVGGQAPHIDMEAVPTLRAAFLQAWQVGASGGGRAVGSPAQSCSETEEGGGGGAGADVGAHLFLIPSEDRLTVTLREVLYFPRLTKMPVVAWVFGQGGPGAVWPWARRHWPCLPSGWPLPPVQVGQGPGLGSQGQGGQMGAVGPPSPVLCSSPG